MVSSEHIGQQFKHQTGHRPADPGYGAPMHDVDSMMPDYHEKPEVYTTYCSNPAVDRESHRAIASAKAKPDAEVRIYRAGPRAEINPGDWVTPSRSYAAQHLESNGKPDWTIAERTAKAKHLYTEGNSIAEWGWHPDGE